MEIKEYRNVVDKSKWGAGPWQDEPDKIQWPDPATGLPCLMVRGPHGGWCGYVGVAEGHALYGKDYEAPNVEVHGGLTFADKCSPRTPEDRGICHVPAPGEPDHVWWFGFDCAHAGDRSPAYEYLLAGQKDRFPHHCPWNPSGFDEYRDVGYVKGQVTALAAQLASQATSSAEPK